MCFQIGKYIDVLFIHPENFGDCKSYLKLPSLEICEMSAVLKASGYSYALIDCNIDRFCVKDSIDLVSKWHPKLILIYSTEFNHINALKTANLLKLLYINLQVGINGMLATFIPNRLIKLYKFDFVIRHNGNYVLKEMLDRKCNIDQYHSINNLSYSYKSTVTHNEKFEDNLAEQPVADREVYQLGKYRKIQVDAIVRSTWGCPSRCSFCNKCIYSSFRIYSMKHFFEEIDLLLKYGYESFFFADDTFAYSQSRLDEFYSFYIAGNYTFKWTSNLRVSDITTKLIQMMKKCGAYRVFAGIETVNSNSNKLVNKNQNNIDLIEKVQIIKNSGIEIHASFIVGNPGDTKEDLENTIKFVNIIKPTLATFNKLKLFPGTPIFNNPKEYGIIYRDRFWFENRNWTDKQLVCTVNLSYEDIEFYSVKMMKELFNV